MSLDINTNYNNCYSYTSQNNTTLKTKSNFASETNGKKPQTLEDFKSELYAVINTMAIHPSQSKTQISVNISDKAFE